MSVGFAKRERVAGARLSGGRGVGRRASGIVIRPISILGCAD